MNDAALKTQDDRLNERYEKAVLAAHRGVRGADTRLANLEKEIAVAEVERRRQEALEAALEKDAAHQARLAAERERAEEEERRTEARHALFDAQDEMKRASKAYVETVAEVMRLGVEADNRSLHREVAEALRVLILHGVPLPFSRRLLNELGSWPHSYGGGSIT